MVNRRDGDRLKHQKLSKGGSGDRVLSSSSAIANRTLLTKNNRGKSLKVSKVEICDQSIFLHITQIMLAVKNLLSYL